MHDLPARMSSFASAAIVTAAGLGALGVGCAGTSTRQHVTVAENVNVPANRWLESRQTPLTAASG